VATKVEEIDLPITSTGDGGEPGHFRIVQLPATRGHELTVLVTHILGSALKHVKTADDIAAAFSSIVTDLSPEREKKLRELLFANVTCNGKPVADKVDALFTGEMSTLYRVLFISFRVNFEGFFNGKLGPAIELLKAKAAAKFSEMSDTSAGPSTGSSSKPPDTEPSTTGTPS
jgi:hypothetical protein